MRRTIEIRSVRDFGLAVAEARIARQLSQAWAAEVTGLKQRSEQD